MKHQNTTCPICKVGYIIENKNDNKPHCLICDYKESNSEKGK